MSPKDFVEALYDEVVNRPAAEYFTELDQCTQSDIKDDYGKSVWKLWSELTDEQRAVVRSIVRQVAIDTVSHMLGIIDGPTLLNKYRGEFCLTYDGGPPLNGDLQDLFLAKAYGWDNDAEDEEAKST